MLKNKFTSAKRIVGYLLLLIISLINLSTGGLGSNTLLSVIPENPLMSRNVMFQPIKSPFTADESLSPPSRNKEFSFPSSAVASGVGGVSFDKIAQPATTFDIKSLKLQYDSKSIDGERLQLVVNNSRVKIELFDWQLIPIARYASSEYNACFTLFGSLVDSQLETTILENKGRILNYHPEFRNTLLGLRLFQMDNLILDPDFTDLPRIDEKYIIGEGEIMPDVQSNLDAFSFVSQFLSRINNGNKQLFRSYIIIDDDVPIRFNIDNNVLSMSGEPFFYFWQYTSDTKGFDLERTQNQIKSILDKQLNSLRNTSDAYHRVVIINTLINSISVYERCFNFYKSGTVVQLMNLTADFNERMAFLQKYRTDDLYSMLIDIETNMVAHDIIYLKELSKLVQSKNSQIASINPNVWDATTKTMQYAAFFRFVRNSFPDAWKVFYSQIALVRPQPRLQTPTVMYKKDNLYLDKLINTYSADNQSSDANERDEGEEDGGDITLSSRDFENEERGSGCSSSHSKRERTEYRNSGNN